MINAIRDLQLFTSIFTKFFCGESTSTFIRFLDWPEGIIFRACKEPCKYGESGRALKERILGPKINNAEKSDYFDKMETSPNTSLWMREEVILVTDGSGDKPVPSGPLAGTMMVHTRLFVLSNNREERGVFTQNFLSLLLSTWAEEPSIRTQAGDEPIRGEGEVRRFAENFNGDPAPEVAGGQAQLGGDKNCLKLRTVTMDCRRRGEAEDSQDTAQITAALSCSIVCVCWPVASGGLAYIYFFAIIMTPAAIIDCAAFPWLGKILSSLVACATVTAIRDYNGRSGELVTLQPPQPVRSAPGSESVKTGRGWTLLCDWWLM